MPFQNANAFQLQVPRHQSAAQRWLRYIFIEDWSLKLIALGITLVLWFAVTDKKKPTTKRFAGVQLTFVHPESVEISNDPVDKVDITLTGSNDQLRINAMDLLAKVIVNDQTTGDRVIRLSPDRVRIDNLPPGVRVESFQPATVAVRLEPIVKRPIDVDIKFEGKVSDGYEVLRAYSTPASVLISGPESHVSKIEKAPTESISLEGKTTNFDLTNVAINIADQKINLLDPFVKIHVEIGERKLEKPAGSTHLQAANAK